MNICHLTFVADSLTYTIAKALTYAGHNVFVWIVNPEHARRHPSKIQSRLLETSRVQVISRNENDLPSLFDRLIVQVFPRPTESLRDFRFLARRGERITLISAGDRSKSWRTAMKLQWLELRTISPYLGKIDRVVYKDGFYSHDFHGLLKSRRVTGFDIHSQFLHSEQSFHAIHDRNWNPESQRPILVNFLGSQDPSVRKRILDSVRTLFMQDSDNQLTRLTNKQMHWTEYSDASPAGLSSKEFLDVLARSDFTLCPLGYSLVTHRPLEALLQGSIPVLSSAELDLYDLGLEDGINCIAVKDGQWHNTVEELARINDENIVEMRRNIFAMLDNTLCYKAASERMRKRLGLPK